MLKHVLSLYCFFAFTYVHAQFHTLKIPQASPPVKEIHRLGVTDIEVEYSSPGVKGRDVWQQVVPFEGKPIPWRAGANMNTRIRFSTAVEIQGKTFPQGSYGFHIIPHKEGKWELLFAGNDEMWGSYYLDTDKDVFARVEVEPLECPFRENLSYEFLNRTDSTVDICLQWAEKQVPFTVKVDLIETTITSFRSELLGINTYHWQAWNDVARWCFDHDTHLEEALTWADRSINGGYNGFAANKNLTNLGTKISLLYALERPEEVPALIEEAKTVLDDPSPAYYFGEELLGQKAYKHAKGFFTACQEKYPEAWFIKMGLAKSDYFLGNKTEAISLLKATYEQSNERAQAYLAGIIEQMESGDF